LSFTIAVSGKGGTGKTTFVGMIIRYLIDKGKKRFSPWMGFHSNLNEVLGVTVSHR
jgi:CO dehydrogenase maturation factor